ncbi:MULTISPECIES: type VII secretion target [Actinokineospora]|uniref:Uncharacterized protein n=1 Tax=Actinokineospora fastidiosa TaxID=1816 RepID=A0A918G5B9_9PSEU|nr:MULTISPECIES: type VII secretion target [Actinokineospora]UVS76379.1 hypothetical protein Actkin_00063 [Actinokineospora sp. UTMC 2448]GGS18648.1 hypothetical protein GCM10010171_08980 [Actinokineospora fastidiosa]
MTGFGVDLDELDALARKAVAIADTVREDTAWRYGVDTDRWPDDDPLRVAVIAYQRSLRAAMERLCGGAAGLSDALRAIAARYRETDEDLARRLTELAG